MRRAAFFALLLIPVAPSLSSEPVAATCTTAPEYDPQLAAWLSPEGNRAAVMEPGRPIFVNLKDGEASLALHIAVKGRYRVAAGGRVWIDLIAAGAPMSSLQHGHGPACSGIRKIVWFDLPAGTHQIRLSKGEAATIRLLVVPAP